ncbi:hypothetical protein JXR93_10880 [bacterium]|nr:hypothetical protein [bacterium]
MSSKVQIFTDSPNTLSKNFIEYDFLDLSLLKQDRESSIVILTDKNRDNEQFQLLTHFVITTFDSDFGDYFSTLETLDSAIKYAISVIDRVKVKNQSEKKIDISNKKETQDKLKTLETITPFNKINKESIQFVEKNSFQGVYVNNILIKEGHSKFFPPFNIWLSALKESFSGEIIFFEQKTEIYKIQLKKGIIVDIISRKKDDHFHSFLIFKGYIPKNSQFIENEKELWSYLVAKNIFLSSDFHPIQHDYKLSILKKILLLKEATFIFKAINVEKNIPIFRDDIDISFELIRFVDNFENFSDNQKFSIVKTVKDINSSVVNKILEYISIGYDFKAILWGLNKISKDDLSRYITTLIQLNIIIFQESSEITFSSGDISLNAEEKILIWIEKIKKEDYFDILGVDIFDSIEYISERYETLHKQFMRFFHIKNIFDKYSTELEEIIFYLESAFKVLSNSELKERYHSSLNSD